MAFLFCDSFDHYGQSNLLQKWTLESGATITASGRNGKGLSLVGGGGISKTLATRQSALTGWACQINPGSGNPLAGQLFSASAVNTNRLLTTLLSMFVLGDSTIALFAGGKLLINPKDFVVTPFTFNYYEVKFDLFAGSTIGVNAEFRVNGEVKGHGTQDTGVPINSLLDPAGKVDVYGYGPGHGTLGATVIDDLYVCDQSGGVNDTYLGDVRISCIYPRADVHNGWTPSQGSTKFNLINEHTPDDDLKYIFDNTAPDCQTCLFDIVQTFSGTIPAVQFLQYARKDNEGSRAYKVAAHSGSYLGANDIFVSDSYKYYHTPFDNDPTSGNPWTPAIINSMDFGMQTTV